MTLTEHAPRFVNLTQTYRGWRSYRSEALLWVTFGSAASILFSIAVSQILLGIGLLLLLVDRPLIDVPPIQMPVAFFVGWTIISDLLSGHPLAGMPQIRKFYVFGIVLLVSVALRTQVQLRALLFAWTGIGVLSATSGFFHVLARHREAVRLKWNSYDFYLDDRIKGFAGHWMTFGAEQMIVLLCLLAYLLFSRNSRFRLIGWCCAACLWISLMLGLTRSIFLLGVPVGVVYLLAAFRPWTLALLPVVALASWFVMPFQVRERVASAVSPHGELDSNAHRYVTRRTGWQMIKAHPWFGLGPEQVGRQFDAYVPPDIHRPLPHGWYGHLHNIYMQYAAERGVPALLFLLWLIGKMLADFGRALWAGRLSEDRRYVVHAAIAVIGAILAEGFFEHNLGDSEVLTMFLIVTSMAYTTIRRAEPCS